MTLREFDPKINSFFRLQTILLLSQDAKSGYELATNLEELTGKRPSNGKLYPFLHELKSNGIIIILSDNDTKGRTKTVYQLTSKGKEMIKAICERLEYIIEYILRSCQHCKVKLLDSDHKLTDKDDNELLFCCILCKNSFFMKHSINLTE